MTGERMVPLLPCASVDRMRDFYLPLGFDVTYQQHRPNPYLALRREGLDLHYFGIDGFVAEDSYGSCLVLVPDTEPLFEAFAAGLRGQFGRLPLTGFPRITRPRRRANAGGLSGFSLIDPSGNWIRVLRNGGEVEDDDAVARGAPASRLGKAHDNAVVLADSKGDVEQAAKILRGALSRRGPQDSRADQVRTLAFLAELYVRLEDVNRARDAIDRVSSLGLSPPERDESAAELARVDELRTDLTDG